MSRKQIIITILIIAIVLGTANVIASSAVANTGSQLQKLYEQESDLTIQNSAVERAIASQKALTEIATHAIPLGLVFPTTIVRLTTPTPVALLQ